MVHDSGQAVLRAARRSARAVDAPLVLAVSGGLDSMVLLHAMAAVARAHIAAVATFDHGSGAAASEAAAHVARSASALGLPVVIGRREGGLPVTGGQEAAWRAARHRFLSEVAAPLGAHIVTAHTEDDQVETVLMRVLRGSGTRGLAGLLAPGVALRPFLMLRRDMLERFAQNAAIAWREDPSNRSRAFLRNRVRHELLPALRRTDSSIDRSLLDIGRRAAAWRTEVESFVDAAVPYERGAPSTLEIARGELTAYGRDSLGVLWPALAGRVGLALDRRGTDRLTSFTMSGQPRGAIPLSGGWRVERRPDAFVLRREPARAGDGASLPDAGTVQWGDFRFHVGDTLRPGSARSAGRAIDRMNAWHAMLPADASAIVRPWSAGDRLEPAGSQPRRRVKRYLTEAGVRGQDRPGWPVVVTGDAVVWIPGVRRSDAATERSGRPVRHYVCERIDR
jgi:tRNA(Ile)-lysidine synthase